jgi:ubiquinone/menaquinone biosynthesis C-methylase UbiE
MDLDHQALHWSDKRPDVQWLSVLRAAGLRPTGTWLDVGCGVGHYAAALAEAGATVIGLEKEASYVQTAKERYQNIRFVQADAARIPLEEGAADACLLRHVLNAVEPDRRETVMRECVRVLSESGALVVETTDIDDIRHHHDCVLYPRLLETFSEVYPTIGELNSLIRRCGFTCVRIHRTERKAGETKSIDDAIEDTARLVLQGRGPTHWRRLTNEERAIFHELRRTRLRQMYPNGVPRSWPETVIVAVKASAFGETTDVLNNA